MTKEKEKNHLFPGTTLVQEIVYLIYNDADTEKAKQQQLKLRCPFIEFVPPFDYGYPNGFEVFKGLSHPKLLKTHLRYEHLSSEAQENLRYVYVVRNPKDTIVSYYHFYRANQSFGKYTGDFTGFLKMFYDNKLDYGNYFDHLRSYTKAKKEGKSKILIVKYEDVLKDKAGQVRRIADFCQKTLSEDAIERIVKHTSFSEMKGNVAVNNQAPTMTAIDAKISPFMRKGEVGDWKNHFTVAQNELMNKYIEKEMETIDINFEYE